MRRVDQIYSEAPITDFAAAVQRSRSQDCEQPAVSGCQPIPLRDDVVFTGIVSARSSEYGDPGDTPLRHGSWSVRPMTQEYVLTFALLARPYGVPAFQPES